MSTDVASSGAPDVPRFEPVRVYTTPNSTRYHTSRSCPRGERAYPTFAILAIESGLCACAKCAFGVAAGVDPASLTLVQTKQAIAAALGLADAVTRKHGSNCQFRNEELLAVVTAALDRDADLLADESRKELVERVEQTFDLERHRGAKILMAEASAAVLRALQNGDRGDPK